MWPPPTTLQTNFTQIFLCSSHTSSALVFAWWNLHKTRQDCLWQSCVLHSIKGSETPDWIYTAAYILVCPLLKVKAKWQPSHQELTQTHSLTNKIATRWHLVQGNSDMQTTGKRTTDTLIGRWPALPPELLLPVCLLFSLNNGKFAHSTAFSMGKVTALRSLSMSITPHLRCHQDPVLTLCFECLGKDHIWSGAE